jgi:hypothetical protein
VRVTLNFEFLLIDWVFNFSTTLSLFCVSFYIFRYPVLKVAKSVVFFWLSVHDIHVFGFLPEI